MIDTKETKARLLRLKELYSSALIAAEGNREKMIRNMNQFLGSDEIDGSSERASIVRNVTYEVVESQISPDIPVPKVSGGSYSEKREKNARAVERLSTAVRSRLPFEELNDRDERYTYIYGGSIFYIEWDNSSESSDEGGIRVHLISPLDFIPQPSIQSVEDMEYCFIHFTTTRSELMTKYGAKREDLSLAECEYLASLDDPMGDTVALIVAFYRGEDGRVGKLVFSGDLVLLDMPNYYKRKIAVCRECGRDATLCRCEKPKIDYRDLDFEWVNTDGKERKEIYLKRKKQFQYRRKRKRRSNDRLFCF